MSHPNKSAYHVPFANRIARIVLRPLFRAVFHLFSPIKISGMENVPKRGAYIVAINHVSLFEAPFIVAFWPSELEAMGASDIWERKGQNLLVRLYHGIPVHRGEYDRELFDQVLSVLNSGRPILIAPEGGRSHQPGMNRAYPGIGYLIEKAQVAVIPVGIVGTTDDYLAKAIHLKRPPLEMHIGKPLRFPPIQEKGENRRKLRQYVADYVMVKIAELLPPEYRGIYANFSLPPIGEGIQ
ncbi:MAG: lysophospholipid acyltransferase family protein [Anaerolineales bacterium]